MKAKKTKTLDELMEALKSLPGFQGLWHEPIWPEVGENS